MATITLRDYLDQLDTILSKGSYDEVIGHCHHILQHFPRNLETYRTLGSALLAKKNHRDAAEVFTSILSASPSDVTGHLGMSATYEAQKDTDSALWHLERAYEIDPQDTEIQAELKRLYQVRDGKPPEEIQMTRTALAHRYLSAQLYDQAISELRHALEEFPDRLDLKVLLAEALYEGNYIKDSGELSLEILQEYPACLPVNSLMVRLWLSAKRPDDARIFLERVEAVAPYESVKLIAGNDSEEKGVFLLPRLEGQVGVAAVSSETPDWMSSVGEISGTFGQTVGDDVSDWIMDGDPESPVGELSETSASEIPLPDLDNDMDWLGGDDVAISAIDDSFELPDMNDILGDSTPVSEEAHTGMTDFLNSIGEDDEEGEAISAGGGITDILSGELEPDTEDSGDTLPGMTDLLDDIEEEEAISAGGGITNILSEEPELDTEDSGLPVASGTTGLLDYLAD